MYRTVVVNVDTIYHTVLNNLEHWIASKTCVSDTWLKVLPPVRAWAAVNAVTQTGLRTLGGHQARPATNVRPRPLPCDLRSATTGPLLNAQRRGGKLREPRISNYDSFNRNCVSCKIPVSYIMSYCCSVVWWFGGKACARWVEKRQITVSLVFFQMQQTQD